MSFPDGPSLSRNPATGGPSKDVGGRLLFLLFMLASFFLIWVLLILVFEAYRRSFFPADAFLSGGTRLGIILSFLPPIVPAGTLAAQLGYWMTGFVPRARRSVEPQGTPAQRAQVEEQRRRLFRFGRLSLVVVLPLAFVGASTFWSLAPSHVALRPMLWLSTYRYSWADLQKRGNGLFPLQKRGQLPLHPHLQEWQEREHCGGFTPFLVGLSATSNRPQGSNLSVQPRRIEWPLRRIHVAQSS